MRDILIVLACNKTINSTKFCDVCLLTEAFRIFDLIHPRRHHPRRPKILMQDLFAAPDLLSGLIQAAPVPPYPDPCCIFKKQKNTMTILTIETMLNLDES